jgi:hypothetical protein
VGGLFVFFCLGRGWGFLGGVGLGWASVWGMEWGRVWGREWGIAADLSVSTPVYMADAVAAVLVTDGPSGSVSLSSTKGGNPCGCGDSLSCSRARCFLRAEPLIRLLNRVVCSSACEGTKALALGTAPSPKIRLVPG